MSTLAPTPWPQSSSGVSNYPQVPPGQRLGLHMLPQAFGEPKECGKVTFRKPTSY